LVDLVWQATEHFEELDHPIMALLPKQAFHRRAEHRLVMRRTPSGTAL